MKTSLRMFAAVELDAAILRNLVRAAEQLRGPAAAFRWTEPKNLHLTLKFFGEVDCETAAEMTKTLPKATAKIPAFTLEVRGLSLFPPQGPPRLLVAETRELPGKAAAQDENGKIYAPRLRALRALLEQWAAEFGFPPERREFMPHVTAARRRSSRGKRGARRHTGGKYDNGSNREAKTDALLAGLKKELYARRERSFGTFTVREVVLFSSELRPEGPLYAPLCRAPLGKTEHGQQ